MTGDPCIPGEAQPLGSEHPDPSSREGKAMSGPIVLRADRWVDVIAGETRSPAVIVVDDKRIVAVNPSDVPSGATEYDLGNVTLLPGLMDMELNLVIGGPFSGNTRPDVEESPSFKTLRGVKNAKTTLDAGFHRPQPRAVPEDRRPPPRRRPHARDRPRVGRRPA